MPVSQNIRRAIESVDNLEQLMLGLNKDPRASNNAEALKAAIADALSQLHSFINGTPGVQAALSQESSQRSTGQQARQARIDSCDTPAA